MAQAHTDVQQDSALLRHLLCAEDHMDTASHEAWSVKRLAEVSGVSAAHFVRSLKQALDIPPHRYLFTRHVEQATALLHDTDPSIIEIAYATGWKSLGTFGRTFRDIIRQSPGALRHHAQAAAPLQQLDRVLACALKVAQRPDPVIAVPEKCRQLAEGINLSPTNNEER